MSDINIEIVRQIVDLNKEGDRLWGGFKHSALNIYIDKVLSLFIDKKLPAAIIIIDNIHPSRAEEVKTMLREKQFNLPTEVRINFLDGGDLIAQFGKKKEEENV